MSGITSSELEQMRSDIESLLPDTCNILSVTRTNSGGVVTDNWGTATASVKCRLDYVRGVKTMTGGAMQPYTGWMFSLPHDTTITANNLIEYSGNQYSVTSVDTEKSWNAVLRVPVEKL